MNDSPPKNRPLGKFIAGRRPKSAGEFAKKRRHEQPASIRKRTGSIDVLVTDDSLFGCYEKSVETVAAIKVL